MIHTYHHYYSTSGNFDWFLFLLFVLAFWLFFLPTWIAVYREHKNAGWIFVINLLFGCTGLGWVGSFIWSIIGESKNFENDSISKADELKKIHNLLKEKIISKQEYDKLKKEIFK